MNRTPNLIAVEVKGGDRPVIFLSWLEAAVRVSEASRYPKGKLLPSMRTLNETIGKLRLGAAISPKEIRTVRDFTKPHPRAIVSLIVFARRQTTKG